VKTVGRFFGNLILNFYNIISFNNFFRQHFIGSILIMIKIETTNNLWEGYAILNNIVIIKM